MDWTLPPNLSTHALAVDQLYYVILVLTGIAFVLVEVGILWFLWRYRGREGRRALYHHGSDRLEVIWTAVPSVLFVGLALYSGKVWADLKGPEARPEEAVHVGVEAKQFEWNFVYPGGDGELGTGDDFVERNHLHIPVRRPVVAHLESEDVIHSFFIPELRVKQDALPGQTIPVWFEAAVPGSYQVGCAELCGLGHYRMSAELTIHEEGEFERWHAERSRESAAGGGSPATAVEASGPGDRRRPNADAE